MKKGTMKAMTAMVKNKQWIQNYDALATTSARKTVCALANAALSAIDTSAVIQATISLERDMLHIKEKIFDLKNFKRIKVVGFGKASCEAARALNDILGSKIDDGIVIDIKTGVHENITVMAGTHPRPSLINVKITKNIFAMAKDTDEKDLILVIVSGGGSALLCSSLNECNQGQKLYDSFLKTGGTIHELNIVRKHISNLKGGGLAKLFYPATVVSLIFCDVPGNHFEDVASGPTYKDETTVADAERILKKYNLSGFNLFETPKEEKYFEKVINIPLISNETALLAMARAAETMGLTSKILSSELYDSPKEIVSKMITAADSADVAIAGGEPTLLINGKNGSGGRNTHITLESIPHLKNNHIFCSFASDGIDNSSAAGAIADEKTIGAMQKLNLDYKKYLETFDSYRFFEKTNDLIMTGQTGANISDIMILLKHDQ